MRSAPRESPRAGPWAGLALARAWAAPDPDSPPRRLALPAGWDGERAAALAALAPGAGPVSLPRLAEGWIGRAVAGLRRAGLEPAEASRLAAAWRRLLLSGRGAPGAAAWRGEGGAPRYVLNLPAFLDEAGALDPDALAEAARDGAWALEGLSGGRPTGARLGFADLAGLLAGLGLDYDQVEGRAAAAGVAALLRGAAGAASGALAARLGARHPLVLDWPAPPAETPVPGLAEAARSALDEAAAAPGLRLARLLALSPPDAAEALLGAETGGLAPAAGPTRWAADGSGEVPSRAARRAGERAARLLAPRGPSARAAMAEALAPWLGAAPTPAEQRAPRPAPSSHGLSHGRGAVWRASVGGQRVTLRTVEAPGGGPAEVSLSVSRDGAGLRAALEALGTAVSLGLSAGVPLEAYVRALAHHRGAFGGAVEGDPEIRRAASPVDWAFRRLARSYLGLALPDPEEAPEDEAEGAGRLPLLPDLPAGPAARRRALRLVG